MDSNQPDSNPNGLCKMGCGFYGNHSYEGLCSKCYKDNIKKQQQSSNTSVNAGRSTPPSGACGTTSGVSLNTSTPVACGATSSTSLNTTTPSTTKSTENTPSIDITQTNNDKCQTPERDITATSVGTSSVSPSNESSSLDDSMSESPDKTKRRNRCYTCRKKVGLTGFECRCGGVFCGLHRYSDKHNCTYDYKADGRQQIAKANPVIVGEKVKRI